MPAALLSAAAAAPASTASPSRGSAPPQAAAAAANGVAPPPAAPVAKPRSRPSQQRQGGSGALAAGRTPELTAFHKQGRHRRDLTGATVTGKVEARFDCGYFVSITVGGMQFGGVLYCPAGTGTAAAGAGGAQGGQQQASRGANRQDAGTGGGGDGGSRRPPAGTGSSVKREGGTAGLEEGGTGGSRPAAKRRRSYRDPNDPTLANKPKSAKVRWLVWVGVSCVCASRVLCALRCESQCAEKPGPHVLRCLYGQSCEAGLGHCFSERQTTSAVMACFPV
jgi:hypothetical protein